MAEVAYKQADRAYNARLRDTRRQIVALYAALYAALRMILAGTYERYARDGKLTYEEMRKYNRLPKLEAEIREELRKLGGKSARLTERELAEAYREMYFDTGAALEKAAGIAIGYAVLRGLLVDEAVARPTTGMSILERIFMHRDDLAARVRQIVTRGLMRGATYSQMMADVRKQLSLDAVRATRWVNTEAHRLLNEARWQAGLEAKAAGVELRKVWVTMADERVRDTHVGMEGQIREIDEYFESPSGAKTLYPGGFGVLEEDTNCRCEIVWLV